MGKIRMHLPLRQDGLTCPLPPLGRLLQSRRERRPRPNRKNVAHANLPLMPMFEFHARSLPAVVLTKNRCILTIETKNSIVSIFNICYLSATGDSGRSVGPMGTTASWPTALLPNAPAAPELRRGASAARPRPMPIWPSSRRPRRWARCRRLCPTRKGLRRPWGVRSATRAGLPCSRYPPIRLARAAHGPKPAGLERAWTGRRRLPPQEITFRMNRVTPSCRFT